MFEGKGKIIMKIPKLSQGFTYEALLEVRRSELPKIRKCIHPPALSNATGKNNIRNRGFKKIENQIERAGVLYIA